MAERPGDATPDWAGLLDPQLAALQARALAANRDIALAAQRWKQAQLLVEQSAHLALEISDQAYVLEDGRVALQGDSKALAQDPQVQALYLGGAHAEAP